MLGIILILSGIALAAGSFVAGYFFVAANCGLAGAPACDAKVSEQISHLMIADTGLLFWLAWVVAVFLIWGGGRLRSVGK